MKVLATEITSVLIRIKNKLKMFKINFQERMTPRPQDSGNPNSCLYRVSLSGDPVPGKFFLFLDRITSSDLLCEE